MEFLAATSEKINSRRISDLHRSLSAPKIVASRSSFRATFYRYIYAFFWPFCRQHFVLINQRKVYGEKKYRSNKTKTQQFRSFPMDEKKKNWAASSFAEECPWTSKPRSCFPAPAVLLSGGALRFKTAVTFQGWCTFECVTFCNANLAVLIGDLMVDTVEAHQFEVQ